MKSGLEPLKFREVELVSFRGTKNDFDFGPIGQVDVFERIEHAAAQPRANANRRFRRVP